MFFSWHLGPCGCSATAEADSLRYAFETGRSQVATHVVSHSGPPGRCILYPLIRHENRALQWRPARRYGCLCLGTSSRRILFSLAVGVNDQLDRFSDRSVVHLFVYTQDSSARRVERLKT